MNVIALPPPAPSPDPAPGLLSADEFVAKYAHHRVELVRGLVRELAVPGSIHGFICSRVTRLLDEFVEDNKLGCVLGNDSFVRTQRDPETVRGADVAYVSYSRLPKGQLTDGVLDVPPDLVVEVKSPSDDWTDIFAKVLEYLAVGVSAVVVIEADRRTASIYRPGGGQEIFTDTDVLTVPEILPGFSVPVARLFP